MAHNLPSDRSPSSPTSRTVLVVEDAPALCHLLQAALAREGLTVEAFAQGEAALLWARQERPALVILDLNLPDLPGEQVGAALAELYGGEVPILVLSSAANASERAQIARATVCLRKPFDLEDLLPHVRTLVNTAPPGRAPRREDGNPPGLRGSAVGESSETARRASDHPLPGVRTTIT